MAVTKSNTDPTPIQIEVRTVLTVDPADVQPVASMVDLYEAVYAASEDVETALVEAGVRVGGSASATTTIVSTAALSGDLVKSED